MLYLVTNLKELKLAIQWAIILKLNNCDIPIAKKMKQRAFVQKLAFYLIVFFQGVVVSCWSTFIPIHFI